MTATDRYGEVAPSPTEQLVRGIFVIFVVLSIVIIGALVTRPADYVYPVGTCLRGNWDGEGVDQIEAVACTEQHDYVVAAVADAWGACPVATVGRVQVSTGGLAPRDRYVCLVGA